MKTTTKVLIIGGVVTLLITGNYLISLNRAQKKIVIVTTAKKGKISMAGVSVIIRYNIKNPTNASMKITPPLIKISVNGKLVATSNMQIFDIPEDVRDKSGKIKIRDSSETGNIETVVEIPWIKLSAIIPDLMKRWQSTDPKDQITVKVETISQVYTLVGSHHYEQTTTMKL